MSKNTIEHEGWISEVKEKTVIVRILSQSACASCHSKAACTLSDIKDKYVELTPQKKYEVGEKVTVVMRQSLGTIAVLLSYVVPFIVLLISIIVFVSLFDNDGLAGLISLGVLTLYFFVLYFFRHRLKRAFEFGLK
jgi:sigma-E factor negative regulatory protein RseC